MKHILALDQGTTSSRAIVFAEDGSVRALAQQEFRQIFPQPGWVEHNPEEIWASQLKVARRALARAALKATDIAAIGITNQRETTILWERQSGRPVYNAIVWQDRRTAAACDSLKRRGKTQAVRSKTGLVLDPYFSATKLAWLLDGIPGLRPRAERGELAFGTVDTWLAWKLSGGALHVTDVSNASRTMLYDIHAGAWDEGLLALFRIPRSLLPRVLPSSHLYGESAKKIFGAAIPIAGIAGDQQAALFGQGCHAPSMAKNTYGTGCFMLLNTGAEAVPSGHGLLTTRCAQPGSKPQYALEGSVFVAGAVVQWLRDGLGIIRASGEIEALAASVEDTGGVYLVPAFAGLGAPHWDAYARGTMLGVTRGTTRAHIARAALEAIAFQSAELLQAMQQDAGLRLTELRVDGGAAANAMLMQFQADILGVPVVRPKVPETTALGAAYLAGLATGVWKDTAEIGRQWAVGRRFEPAMSRAEAEARMAGWTRALERSKDWIER
ncbi:MAG: glycerol kinase GlpK [Betaproteobacteria bacterium]|nr:glycerol kinase GlpK [Betaproteobacteria bacterium]